MSKRMTRRELLRVGVLGSMAAFLAACQPKVVEKVVEKEVTKIVKEVVKETIIVEGTPQVVEKEVTKIVKEVVAPTPAPPEEATVVVMYNTNELTEEERDQFMDKYPQYTLEFIETDLTRMYAMLAGGNQLDMFRIYGTFVPGLTLQRIPLDLTDYFATSEVLKVDDLVDANDLYVVHGRRYGMVKDWSPDVSIWLNKSLWEEAGITPPDPLTSLALEEWRALSPKLTQKEGDQVTVVGTYFTPNEHHLFWLSCCYGKANNLFTEDFSRVTLLDNPDVYESAKFWADWQKELGLVSVLNPAPATWSGEAFVSRAAATCQWGYWFGGMAESDDVPGEDILMLPGPMWGTDYANPCVTGCGAVITSVTRVPEAAWKLFEWFMGEEPAEARATSGWGVPGLKSQLSLMPQDEPWRQNNYAVVQHEIENTSLARIDFCPYITPDTFKAAWNQYEEPMLLGDLTLDEMLKLVEDEINEAIEEGMERAGLL